MEFCSRLKPLSSKCRHYYLWLVGSTDLRYFRVARLLSTRLVKNDCAARDMCAQITSRATRLVHYIHFLGTSFNRRIILPSHLFYMYIPSYPESTRKQWSPVMITQIISHIFKRGEDEISIHAHMLAGGQYARVYDDVTHTTFSLLVWGELRVISHNLTNVYVYALLNMSE